MPVAQNDSYKVQEITHLKSRPRAAEALELLKRVALQVQPIMRKRQWTVKKLSEFIPKSNNLLGLNVNRGAEVKIRLRPPGQEDSFYSWNHVLGTMLHELCHNNIGPHNAAFYKLLDELWSEAEDLIDRGITGSGQGFDAPSAGRLGSHSFIPTHNPPEHRMTDAIHKAAEARAQKAALMPSGPRRLGGSSDTYKGMTPAQAAAAAAERRARDNLWCGAEHNAEQVQLEVGSGEISPSTSAGAAAGGARQQEKAAAGPSRMGMGAAAAAAVTTIAAAGIVGQGQRLQQQRVGPSTSARTTATAAAAAAAPAALQRNLQQQAQQLQQEWQTRVQKQQQQRQQQQSRKRAAPDTIDLTVSDDDSDGGMAVGDAGSRQKAAAAAAVGSSGVANLTDGAASTVPCNCPCCLLGFAETENAAAAAAGGAAGQGAASSFRVWCAKRRQWMQQQQQLDKRKADEGDSKQQQHTAAEACDSWSCPVCTLVNAPLALQCEACLTVRKSA